MFPAPPIATTATPSASRSRPRRAASVSTATRSLTPSTSTTARIRPAYVRAAIGRPSARRRQICLVSEHHGLDAVAEVELLEDVRDVCLDGRLADVELFRDLAVREAARHQAKDVALARAEIVELLRGSRTWDAGELLDHAFRDRRGEERVAGGDRADRGDQLLGRVVLEDEAARACSQRLVDVLVEVERREDQDPRAVVGREDASSRLRARRARACGCPSGRRSDRSGRPCPPPRARCSPRPRLRCPPRRRAACESRRGPSTGRRPRARGSSSLFSLEWEARAEDEAAPGRRSCGHLAAVDLDAFADADEPVPEAVGRRAAETVVAYLDLAARPAGSGRSRPRGWRCACLRALVRPS